MDDVISRQAAIHEVNNHRYVFKNKHLNDYEQGWNDACDYCADEWLEQLSSPSAQKTGHWVKVSGYATPGGDPVWACSECGKGLHTYGIEHGSYGTHISTGQWVACPNCGADMRGEEN